MPNKTNNFNLDLPVGDDLFNPLWPNSNTNKIDAQMKKNMDNSVTKADCVFNTNKFIITREDKTGKIFKFIAPNDYVAGYTFTVDGTAMDGIVAGTGDTLADGCFMNGHEVIAYIDETTASLAFLVGSSLPDAIDATTLEGHGADYFATAAGLAATNQVATSAGQVANQALEAAQKAGMKKTVVFSGSLVNGSTLTNVPENVKFFVFAPSNGIAMIVNPETGGFARYFDYGFNNVTQATLHFITFSISSNRVFFSGAMEIAINGTSVNLHVWDYVSSQFSNFTIYALS